MDGSAAAGSLRCFLDLPAPRACNVSYRLIDLLLIAVCATACGADGWKDFHLFAKSKAQFFRRFLDLRHGVPILLADYQLLTRPKPAPAVVRV